MDEPITLKSWLMFLISALGYVAALTFVILIGGMLLGTLP